MRTARRSGDKPANPVPVSPAGKAHGKTPSGTITEQLPVAEAFETKDRKSKKPDKGPAAGKAADESAKPGAGGRAFWSGSITIGLVNVPVRLQSMVKDTSFSFRLLHRTDGQPLRYDRVCSREGRVIPWTETVKGYEIRKGEFLVFEPDELKAVMPESDRKIRISKFVHYLSLDPMYFENSYVLVPDRSEEAYNLLLTAISEMNLAATGTITLRTKEHPVVVHAYRGGLVLTTLRYVDEVTPPDAMEAFAGLPVPKETELALAKRIIAELTGDFSLSDFHDRYREAIEALIEKKLAGEKIVYEEPHPEEAKELMQALKETLATLSAK